MERPPPRGRVDMSDSVALGLNGLSIPAGTHICAFFRGVPERDQILVPFLTEGRRAGDKCTCIIDDEVDGVRTALGADAADIDIRSSKETYLRRGPFSTRGTVLENLHYLEPDESLASRE